MPINSGEVQEPVANVFIGVTNFSEFTLGAGIPAGITASGLDNGGAPDVFAIADGGAEGNYFSMQGQDAFNAQSIFSFDFADGDFWPADPQIEILARVFVGPTTRSNHFGLAVGFLMDGTLANTLDVTGAEQLKQGGPSLHTIVGGMLNGGSGTFGQGQTQTAVGLGDWHWMRFRFNRNVNMVGWDWRSKIWLGDLADEPGTWDNERLNQSFIGNLAGQRMGVWMSQGITPAIDQDEQRIAFFSFTTDPAQAAAPTPDDVLNPGDILPPTVTVDPIQDTWVGLSSTPFEVVP